MKAELLSFIKNALLGAIIGTTNVIPGISGGTVAVVLGAYSTIITNISRLTKDWKRSLLFLVPFAIGAVGGIYAFAGMASYAFFTWPMATNLLFAGLIIGSAPMLLEYALYGTGTADTGENEKGVAIETARPPIQIVSLIVAAVAFAAMLAMVFVAPDEMAHTAQRELTLVLGISLFVASALAAVAMLLPGLSGALMFVIFGVYGTISAAIAELNVVMLLPVAAGVLVGVLGGARIIDILLTKFERTTYWGVLGLMAGSVVQLSSFASSASEGFNLQFVIAWGLMFFGIAVAYVFSMFGLKRKDTSTIDMV